MTLPQKAKPHVKNTVILFDFDGTIADTFENFILIGNALAKEFQFQSLAQHQIEDFKNKTIRQAIQDLEVPILQIPKLLFKGKQELKNRMHTIKVIDGMTDVLKTCKTQNIKMGLVSTNALKNIQAMLQNWHLDHLFEFIGTGSGLFGKRRALNKIIKQNSLKKDDILYVGDEVRDIEASRGVGIAVASVTWGYNSRKVLQTYAPDYLIDHPQELLHIIKEMNTSK